LLGRAGPTFRQVLAALTTAPTKRLGFAATAGRVADGQDADLVIFDSAPADDIMAFSRTKMALRRGRIIYRAEGQESMFDSWVAILTVRPAIRN
jgi:imidazolonepropionase-like amidohydrolase